MSHLIEAAVSGRAKCRACGERIAAGERRFGERVPNPFGDDGSETTHWYHVACAAFMRPEAFVETLAATTEPIEHRAFLEHEAALGIAHRRLPRAHKAERASSGRATCRSCRQIIAKDDWRISLLYYEDGRLMPSGFVHAYCAQAYFETTEVMARLKHFTLGLTNADLETLQTEIAKESPPAVNPA